jgi:Protein kinase domain
MDVPQTLGKYDIRGTLGRGAMGVVYDGWDPQIARRVAIKVVPLPVNPDPDTAEEIARFRREAQAAGRLTHPNIVGVYDYGETSDLAYIVMEHVDGPTLKTVLDKKERFPLDNIGRVMADTLAGLQFSHERGVVHRDIKPGNIMLTSQGQAKIADFGIARIEMSSMTQAGTMLGTPAYMSPEQFRGEAADARTDVYSAGVVLYQLLTGERPFEGGLTAIMHKVLNTEPPVPSQLAGSVPPALDTVVKTAMAKRVQDRFASAAKFAEALRTAIAAAGTAGALDDDDEATQVRPGRGAAPAARSAPPPPPPPAAAPAKSRAPLFGAIAVVVVAVLAGAGWFLTRSASPPPAEQLTAQTQQTGQTTTTTPPVPVAPTVAEVQPPPTAPAQVQPTPPPVAPAKPAEPPPAMTTATPTPRPVVTQPVVTQPVVTPPAVTKPAVIQPVVPKPAVTQPAVSQPVVTQPATKPAVAPTTAAPVIAKPAEPPPATTTATTTAASTPPPPVTQPAVTQPAVTQPAVIQPGAAKPAATPAVAAATTTPTVAPITAKPAEPPPPAQALPSTTAAATAPALTTAPAPGNQAPPPPTPSTPTPSTPTLPTPALPTAKLPGSQAPAQANVQTATGAAPAIPVQPSAKPAEPTASTTPLVPTPQLPTPQLVAPKPPEPSPPATEKNTQTASVTPVAMLAQIAQALHGAHCALAASGQQDSGALAVDGFADASTIATLHRQIDGVVGAPPVAWQLATIDSAFCPVLAALRPISPLAGAPGPAPGLTLNANRLVLKDGESILPRVTMPDFAGELRVDYLSHDGSMAHLFPTLADPAAKLHAQPARRFAPGEHLALGDPGPGRPEWQSGTPYGTDMIIAVASSVPLKVAAPHNAEDNSDAYIADLGRAIEQARAAGVRVSGALLLVEAVPK